MLAFVTTDAAVEPKSLRLALSEAVAKSFNRITVDAVGSQRKFAPAVELTSIDPPAVPRIALAG